MKYFSTRGNSKHFSFSEALKYGLAPDGGLFLPEKFEQVRLSDFEDKMSFADFAVKLLTPFVDGDTGFEDRLPAICQAAFQFPTPLRFRKERSAVLELFHGPTSAFKDVGARFLAECFSNDLDSHKKRTVIVATSGDTGGAVASAFLGKDNIEVFVLFPKGKISKRQEKQITAWGKNIKALAVRGSFDDCQKIVKEALSDSNWHKEKHFISANSISIGRLLPQMIYYAQSSLEYLQNSKVNPGYIIPTGNLGNAVAALWAKKLGFPIANVVLATNANHSIGDFFSTGIWKPNPTIATLANAMDVGNPSNIERLRALYPKLEDLKNEVTAISVSDQEITNAIQNEYQSSKEVFCPHTVTAMVAEKKVSGKNWILVSTAHPAKFESVVEPLIGEKIEIPRSLANLLNLPSVFQEIDPSFAAFKSFVDHSR